MSGSVTPSHRNADDDVLIPDHWHPEIEKHIAEKQFSTSAQNEIIRILVTQMFCKKINQLVYSVKMLLKNSF